MSEKKYLGVHKEYGWLQKPMTRKEMFNNGCSSDYRWYEFSLEKLKEVSPELIINET